MPIIQNKTVEDLALHDGATYKTIVGDDEGSTPIRLGLQTSPPGFNTGIHWHPYMEIVIVLEGQGEAWIDGEDHAEKIGSGTTMVFHPMVKHWFSVTGEEPMKTYGIHASHERIVER